MGDDEDFIQQEFEWALKDPTEEKLRDLGEVVSTITKKLVEAITGIQNDVYGIQTSLESIEAKVNRLESRGVAAPGPSPAASAADSTPEASIAKAPTPKPAPASGPGGMMGELKALLAARRRKADSGSSE